MKMCLSIVMAANLAGAEAPRFKDRVIELGRVYEYGIGMYLQKLVPAAQEAIIDLLHEPGVIFEVHDLAEAHCACDVDQDIRNGSRLGKPSKFFDFVKEILEYKGLSTLSILFFQEQLPEPGNIRKQMGSYGEFVDLLNRWNTWQVEGFEPTRQAYFIADDSPLYFIFTKSQHTQ